MTHEQFPGWLGFFPLHIYFLLVYFIITGPSYYNYIPYEEPHHCFKIT